MAPSAAAAARLRPLLRHRMARSRLAPRSSPTPWASTSPPTCAACTHDIQRNWDPLIPEEVQPPLMKKGIVGIRFTILPDGKIGAMTLETRSGDVALDHAAWNAITSEGQFPPLPQALPRPAARAARRLLLQHPAPGVDNL